VSIWIAVKDLFPDADFPKSVWKHDDPLNVHEKNVLSKVMRGSSVAAEQPENKTAVKGQSGFWKPRLHFAWDVILTRLCDENLAAKTSNNKSSRSSRISFRDFWNEVVDGIYFLI
jgi:DNA polymerase phi